MNKDLAIKEAIKTYFDFLSTIFSATLIKEEIVSYGVFLTYVTKKAGLRISFEPRDGGLFVMVFPLKEQKIPEYEDWYDVVDLFQAKGVKFVEKSISNCNNPEMEEVKQALKHFAENVRIHAEGFLGGEFNIIEVLEQIIKRRSESMGS